MSNVAGFVVFFFAGAVCVLLLVKLLSFLGLLSLHAQFWWESRFIDNRCVHDFLEVPCEDCDCEACIGSVTELPPRVDQ